MMRRIAGWATAILLVVATVLFARLGLPIWRQARFEKLCATASSLVVNSKGRVSRLSGADADGFLRILTAGTSPDNGVYLNMGPTMRIDLFDGRGEHFANVLVHPGNRTGGACVCEILSAIALSGRRLTETENGELYAQFPDCRDCIVRPYHE